MFWYFIQCYLLGEIKPMHMREIQSASTKYPHFDFEGTTYETTNDMAQRIMHTARV